MCPVCPSETTDQSQALLASLAVALLSGVLLLYVSRVYSGGDTPVRTANDPRQRSQSAEGGIGGHQPRQARQFPIYLDLLILAAVML